jgi:lysophospholipase L1-like esterase
MRYAVVLHLLMLAPVAGVCALTACAGAGLDDDGLVDAGADGDPGADSGPLPHAGPEFYGSERSLSPITSHVAENLRAIAGRGPAQRDNVFAKVGDSATLSSNFAHCLDSGYVDPGPGEQSGESDLAGRDQLKSTIAHFRGGNAGGTSPFTRASRAAAVSWNAGNALAGNPAPLDSEYAAIMPRFAVIMFGTRDIDLGDFDAFGASLLDIADRSITAGIIPIFTSIMPRDDAPAAGAQVPGYNAIVRGVAQARQVPFIDLHRELAMLPDHGLGEDRVHPSVYRDSEIARACVFSAEGLAHGYNIRNLLTLETLHRLLRVVLLGEDAPDPPARSVQGTGTAEDPFVIAELPFSHAADTSTSGAREVDRYEGCMAAQDESGPELIYRLDLDRPARIRAMVIDRGTTDIDVHLMQGGSDAQSCIARDHRVVVRDLGPGTYYFNLDTWVDSSGDEKVGEYLLVVLEDTQ